MNIITIWQDVSQQLYPWILSRTHDRELSRDILQEVFIKVQTRIDTLKETRKVSGWIFRIAQTTLAEYYRKQSRIVVDSEKALSQADFAPEINDGVTEEFAQCLLPMIESLPDIYRGALYYYEIKGMSQKDLAAQLGISYSGAKSRVQRGRKMLKQKLVECCEIEFDRYGNVLSYESRKSVKLSPKSDTSTEEAKPSHPIRY